MSAALLLPDTALVREATGMIRAAVSPAIFNHSQRTFLLGRAWARKRKLVFDDEALLLAALFHDLGMFPPHRDPARPFTFVSSDALRAFLAERGFPQERTNAAAEAIELHMQLRPRFDRSAVAGLLQVGAWMDVTGLRRWSVREEAQTIGAEWPRLGIDLAFPRLLLGTVGSIASCSGLLLPSRGR